MKKLILQLSLTLLTFSGLAQIPTNGLVAYYPFNGNANDLSGNNINGVVNGATLTTDRFGNTNSAYSFNGTSNYIIITHNQAKINLTTDFTVSFWFNAKGKFYSDDRGTLFTSRHDVVGNEQGGIEIALVPKNLLAKLPNTTSTQFSLNNWYNYTATFKKNGGRETYINNIRVDSVATPSILASSPILIGGDNNTSLGLSHFFGGILDDYRVYNRILTPTEIANIFNDNQCFNKIAVSDTLKITSTITGLNDLPLNFGTVKVYPNPTSDILNISYDKPNPNYTINIFNSSAVNVYSTVLNQANTQLNISTYAKGIYVIKIQDLNSNVLETKKLVIQ